MGCLSAIKTKYTCLFQIQVCTMKGSCMSNKKDNGDLERKETAEYLAKRRENYLSN